MAGDALRKLRVLTFRISILICLSFAFISLASARVYESPYSQEIAGTPNADIEPPVTTITISQPRYSSGNDLYINGSTTITLSATDYGIVSSGVNYTEYKIDNVSTWTKYTNPFNLSTYSDGTHTIHYRSVDKASNIETEKTTIIILDKTPPETTISASEELLNGITNTVSPDTRFYLSATDNISGVRVTQYRIDQGEWLDYLAGFTLSGAGTHTIGYKAKDNVENEEAEKTLTVKLISLNITKEISLDPIVLAGAWEKKGEEGEEGGKSGEREKGRTESKTDKSWDRLAAILSSSGLSYYIPETEEEFKEVLRQGRYNTYLLIDFAKEDLTEELKSAVHYGDGLVYIKTQSDDEHNISDLFGVQFNGMSTNKNMVVNLTKSEISGVATLQSKGKAVKTTITSTETQSLGYVNDKKETYPVIISNQYGRGKTILFSFDLLNSTDQSKVSSLIINSINYVTPSEYYTRALADVPISITLKNSTEPVDIKVTETLPDNTTADSINPSATQDNNTIQWQLSLTGSEKKKLQYRLSLPDTSGDYKTNTEITYSNQGNYKLYGNYSLTLTIEHSSSQLQSQIITDLNSLQAEGKNKDHINEAIEELNEINRNASNRKEAEKNIERIIEAIEELSEVSIDASSIRLKLDELLKIWEKKWYLMEE